MKAGVDVYRKKVCTWDITAGIQIVNERSTCISEIRY
jgi:hypothetical protein